MLVFGSADLSAALAEADLFDEYRLMIAPVVLGAGTPLFGRGLPHRRLRLLEARTFASGGVLLRYVPVARRRRLTPCSAFSSSATTTPSRRARRWSRTIHGWHAEMERRGILRDGRPLRPPTDAVTIRVRRGRPEITGGPFAATAEQMAAYELLECADLEEAVGLASRHPMAAAGAIEVRPVWEDLALRSAAGAGREDAP